MILNTLGVLLGFLCNRLIQKKRIERQRQRERRKVHIRKLEL